MSPEEALEEFKRLGLDIAVKNPRSGGMALEDMKMVAKLCGISSNLKKQAMAESINTHLCNRAKLLPYVFAGKQPLSNLSIFKKDKTCIPRLCNILFSKYKDELAQSSLAATREQLQFGEIRDKAPFWGNLAEDFSNPSEDAGGLIREDSALKDIDVNKIITVMTAKEAYHIFNDTMKAYRSAKRNWLKRLAIYNVHRLPVLAPLGRGRGSSTAGTVHQRGLIDRRWPGLVVIQTQLPQRLWSQRSANHRQNMIR